jgi:predicted MPP superfamily phosphohydrolase
MRLAWLTDIHLNFVDAAKVDDFLASVRDRADAGAISGDIAEGHNIWHYLRSIEEIVQKPIYFVLGNHDFYRRPILLLRKTVADLAIDSKFLNYLTAMQVVELTPSTAIIGHDGWADARLGDYRRSNVILSDHLLISELARWFDGSRLDKDNLLRTMTALADEAAGHLATVLGEAASKYPNVIAVTHVPPFREAAWYQGKPSNDDYLPHFACKVVGDIMRAVMREHPTSNLLVLCGHTHGGGEFQASDNIRVLTGEAEYGRPRITRVLQVD